MHVSLVALHAAMLTSGHLESSGAIWDTVRKHPIYTFAQAGGTQVDLMFMLSGYLLVYKLLSEFASSKSSLSAMLFAIHRALRFIPPIIAVSIIGYIIGDTWDGAETRGEVSALSRIASFISFSANYIPPSVVGCFTLSLCWSLCVDLHAGVILTLIVGFTKGGLISEHENGVHLANRLRWVFLILTAISIGIRAYLFEVDSINLFKLGQYSHFGLLMTDNSYAWIQNYYGHVWRTKNTAVDMAQGYLVAMYNPTHTRIGPFFVGAIVACNVYLARLHTPQKTVLGTVCCWVLTLQALITLLIPCLPAEDNVPVIGQLIATAALRTLSAVAAGFLLYRALVPKEHGWHWAALNKFLSLKCFAPIATLSYCSYLIHFRLLMELNFRGNVHKWIMSLPPFASTDYTAAAYIAYIPKLFICAMLLSLCISRLLSEIVEKPAALAVNAYLFPRPKRMSRSANSSAADLPSLKAD